MPARSMKLKRRVTFALATLVAVFVVVQGGLAYLSLMDQEDDLVDELVLAEAKRLAGRLEQDGVQGMRSADLLSLSPNFSAWLVEPGGRTSPAPLPAHLADLSDGPHRPAIVGEELHVFAMPLPEGRLYVQYDAERNEEKVRQFGIYLLGLGTLCIALGIAVSRYIAAVVVAPIERLTQLLSAWAPDAPVGESAVSDEESRMLDAFRRVQGRFEQAVAHEREFIANARHEIRTPLAALRTDIEMLALHAAPADRPRLQRALDAVDAIAGSVELAHTLSRRQATDTQSVDLAQCLDDAWISLGAFPESRRLRFINAVPAGTLVHADRHALLTILRNLIRNAAEHAAPACCSVSYTGRGIEVRDDGPGIAAADIPFVFERYYRGRLVDAPEQEGVRANGERGLGLAIARQVADLHGWRLHVESTPGQGSCFILALS